MNKFNKSLLAASIFAAFSSMTAGVALATDHGDNVMINGAARNDARITDYFALNRGDKIAFIIDTNPTIGAPGTLQNAYTFPTDVTFAANVDNHSAVNFDDPVRNLQHGGTVTNPADIRENFTFTFTFAAGNVLSVNMSTTDTALGISGFYPTAVKPGELVYVLGSGFKSDETKVKVNGRNVGLRYVVSDNVLVFVAPLNAKTGKVSITTETEGAGDDDEIKVRVTSASDLSINRSEANDDDDSDDDRGISSGAQALRAIATNSTAVAKVNAGDVSGLADIGLPVQTFSGLRDDPFIRLPQQGRNIAAMAVELPQSLFTHGRQKVLLSWGTSKVNTVVGDSSELSGRSFATMFTPEQNSVVDAAGFTHLTLNALHPSKHVAALEAREAAAPVGAANRNLFLLPCQTAFQTPTNPLNPTTSPLTLGFECAPGTRMLKAPDVMIFDTSKPQVFPNGRDLTNDQIDYIGLTFDPRVENLRRMEMTATGNDRQGDPFLANPSANDVDHDTNFPYLGLPQN